MEVFRTSVALTIRALVVSARWAGRGRQLSLEQMTAAAEANRVVTLEAQVAVLEDRLELCEAHISVLESRLGQERPRKPYPLMERLRIIWLMQYFQIPGRRLRETLGVSRSSVRRWLKGFEEGKLGKRNEPKEPVNKTPREIAQLIWEVFREDPLWGRHRIAMVVWGLGVFIAASTVRNILLRPGPRSEDAPVTAAIKPERSNESLALANLAHLGAGGDRPLLPQGRRPLSPGGSQPGLGGRGAGGCIPAPWVAQASD
jgi:transposase